MGGGDRAGGDPRAPDRTPPAPHRAVLRQQKTRLVFPTPTALDSDFRPCYNGDISRDGFGVGTPEPEALAGALGSYSNSISFCCRSVKVSVTLLRFWRRVSPPQPLLTPYRPEQAAQSQQGRLLLYHHRNAGRGRLDAEHPGAAGRARCF